MTVRLRKMPIPVIILIAVCTVFLWSVFLVGPLYKTATNRIVPGRVVRVETRKLAVLMDDATYMVESDCFNVGLRSLCEQYEGQTGLYLVNRPDTIGYRFDQIITSVGVGLMGTLFMVALFVELQIRKPKVYHRERHHSRRQ